MPEGSKQSLMASRALASLHVCRRKALCDASRAGIVRRLTVPRPWQDVYRLACVNARAMEALEGGLAMLREDVASHKETIAETEHLLAAHYSRISHTLQARAPADSGCFPCSIKPCCLQG